MIQMQKEAHSFSPLPAADTDASEGSSQHETSSAHSQSDPSGSIPSNSDHPMSIHSPTEEISPITPIPFDSDMPDHLLFIYDLVYYTAILSILY